MDKLPKWRGITLLLASFFGLCAAFALVVTLAEGWQEHLQAKWPEATALVQRCEMKIYSHKRELYRIDCSVGYRVRGDWIVSHVYSRSTPAPRRVIWQYPPQQFKKLQDWVDAHPEGTPVSVHYDPANHGKAVLVETDMPLGGPRTPNNLRVLAIALTGCLGLLTVARITKPRTSVLKGDG